MNKLHFVEPSEFPEVNLHLSRPVDWDESRGACKGLPVYKDDSGYWSLWKVPFMQRVSFLFNGKIWLQVAGNGHPPVAIAVGDAVLVEPVKEDIVPWPYAPEVSR